MEDQFSENKFKQAVEYVKNLTPDNSKNSKIDNATRLQFYAYFKQATDGECKIKAPSKLKMVERAKYDSWKALGKMNKQEAMKQYIQKLSSLVQNWDKITAKL